jgi:DNA-binding transcriptional LysR family regulator
MRRLRLPQLQLVFMAGQGANFRDVAHALSVTQPAVTKMAHELELALGAPVFERGTSGMRLTTFGTAVLSHVRRAMTALAQLEEDLPGYREGVVPALRIGSPSFTAAELLARPVARWLQQLPGARVLMSEGVSARLVAALEAGELDCVIGSVDEGSLSDDEVAELSFEVLYDDCVTFVTHPDTPGARRLTRLAQLQALRWVLPPRASQVWMALRQAFAAGGLTLPPGVVEGSSIPAIGAILREAPGTIGALRVDAGRYLARNFGLRVLRIAPRIALPPVGIMRLRSAPPSAAMEALLSLVRDEVRSMSGTRRG